MGKPFQFLQLQEEDEFENDMNEEEGKKRRGYKGSRKISTDKHALNVLFAYSYSYM